MAMDIASFAKQLKEEGVEAAKIEAKKIKTEATAEAEKIINNARNEASRLEKEAQANIQQSRQRSEDEMRLVARDLLNTFRKKIEEVGCKLLKVKVAESINSTEVVQTAVVELLKNQQSGQKWEVALGDKISKSLADVVLSSFKERGAIAELSGELSKVGFEVKQLGNNEVFEVSEDSVTESFKKFLSPELKKLLEA